MDQQELLKQCLEDAVSKARRQKNILSVTEVRSIFQKIDLKEEQMGMIYDYLAGKKITILSEDESESLAAEKEAEDALYLAESESDGEGRDIVKLYCSELSNFTDEERLAIAKRALEGDEAAKQELITAYLPNVVEIAKLYTEEYIVLEDLIQEGNLGLMMGVQILDCVDTPEEVEGHLGRMIMEAMDASLQSQQSVSADLQKFSGDTIEILENVSFKAKELSDSLRRPVTANELSVEYNIPMNDILMAIELTSGKIEGLISGESDLHYD